MNTEDEPTTYAGLSLWEWAESDALPLQEFGFDTVRDAIVAIENQAVVNSVDVGALEATIGVWFRPPAGFLSFHDFVVPFLEEYRRQVAIRRAQRVEKDR